MVNKVIVDYTIFLFVVISSIFYYHRLSLYLSLSLSLILSTYFDSFSFKLESVFIVLNAH